MGRQLPCLVGGAPCQSVLHESCTYVPMHIYAAAAAAHLPVGERRDDEAAAVAQVLVAVLARRVQHAHHQRAVLLGLGRRRGRGRGRAAGRAACRRSTCVSSRFRSAVATGHVVAPAACRHALAHCRGRAVRRPGAVGAIWLLLGGSGRVPDGSGSRFHVPRRLRRAYSCTEQRLVGDPHRPCSPSLPRCLP